MHTLLVARYLSFVSIILLNVGVAVFAAWNFTALPLHSGDLSTLDPYIVVVAAMTVFLLPALLYVDLTRRNAILSRAWFELLWMIVLWFLELAGGSRLAANLPFYSCAEPFATCTAPKVALALVWSIVLILFVHIIALILLSFCVMKEPDQPSPVNQSVSEHPFFHPPAPTFSPVLPSFPSKVAHAKLTRIRRGSERLTMDEEKFWGSENGAPTSPVGPTLPCINRVERLPDLVPSLPYLSQPHTRSPRRSHEQQGPMSPSNPRAASNWSPRSPTEGMAHPVPPIPAARRSISGPIYLTSPPPSGQNRIRMTVERTARPPSTGPISPHLSRVPTRRDSRPKSYIPAAPPPVTLPLRIPLRSKTTDGNQPEWPAKGSTREIPILSNAASFYPAVPLAASLAPHASMTRLVSTGPKRSGQGAAKPPTSSSARYLSERRQSLAGMDTRNITGAELYAKYASDPRMPGRP